MIHFSVFVSAKKSFLLKITAFRITPSATESDYSLPSSRNSVNGENSVYEHDHIPKNITAEGSFLRETIIEDKVVHVQVIKLRMGNTDIALLSP